jgi:hypothetical protein
MTGAEENYLLRKFIICSRGRRSIRSMIRMRIAHKILVWKPERKKLRREARCRYEDNIKLHI